MVHGMHTSKGLSFIFWLVVLMPYLVGVIMLDMYLDIDGVHMEVLDCLGLLCGYVHVVVLDFLGLLCWVYTLTSMGYMWQYLLCMGACKF